MKFEELKGKTLTGIVVDNINDEIIFIASEERFKMFHEQDCCESVTIEDICGDVADLIGMPILEAEEATNSADNPKEDSDDSFTWTFYKLRTVKGGVTIRWYGCSNGYYSESVTLERVK